MYNNNTMIDFNYRNSTCNMLVLRCIGSDNFFLERVLFPAEEIVFSVPYEAKIEIWGNELYGPKLEQRIRIASQSQELPFAA